LAAHGAKVNIKKKNAQKSFTLINAQQRACNAYTTTTSLSDATVTPNTVPAPLVQPSILAAGDSPFVI
jgi:hypothetical protein